MPAIDTSGAAARVTAFLDAGPRLDAVRLSGTNGSAPVLRTAVLWDLVHGRAAGADTDEVNLYLSWHERFAAAEVVPHLAFLAGGPTSHPSLHLVDVDLLLCAANPGYLPGWAEDHAAELWETPPGGRLARWALAVLRMRRRHVALARASAAYPHAARTVAGVEIPADTAAGQIEAIARTVVLTSLSLPVPYDPGAAR